MAQKEGLVPELPCVLSPGESLKQSSRVKSVTLSRSGNQDLGPPCWAFWFGEG